MRISSPLAVVLDATRLSMLAYLPGHRAGDSCRAWERRLRAAGCRVYVPQIADYEARRELVRLKNTTAIALLDAYLSAVPDRYLPLTTPDVYLACDSWAAVRQIGRPTASPDALDGDVLITTQAIRIVPADHGLAGVVIATANVGHLTTIANTGPGPRVAVELWTNIFP